MESKLPEYYIKTSDISGVFLLTVNCFTVSCIHRVYITSTTSCEIFAILKLQQTDSAPLIHEIRKIGTNLNQLAYYSNIGQDSKVRAEIVAIRQANEAVMKRILAFLDDPKFKVK